MDRVESTQHILIRERIGTLQGILENIAAKEKDLITQTLSLYGAAPDHGILMLTDQDGKVVSSTQYQDIGFSWQETAFAEQQIPALVLREQSVLVRVSDDRQWQDAYASICRAGTRRTQGLREQICGVLYYRQNLQYHKNIALGDIYRVLGLISTGSVFLGFILWAFLHQRLTKRTADIIKVLGQYRRGSDI